MCMENSIQTKAAKFHYLWLFIIIVRSVRSYIQKLLNFHLEHIIIIIIIIIISIIISYDWIVTDIYWRQTFSCLYDFRIATVVYLFHFA